MGDAKRGRVRQTIPGQGKSMRTARGAEGNDEQLSEARDRARTEVARSELKAG